MKLFPEGRSRPLSGLALAAATGCGGFWLVAARDLYIFFEISSTQAFLLEMAHSTVPAEMPPLAGFLVRHMRLAFIFPVVFWFSGFILALGVWRRREWARRGAAYMLYLLSAIALLLLLFPGLAIPRQLYYNGVSLAPEFNAAVRSAGFIARITALLGGSLCLWWALALDRGALREEFKGGVERTGGI